MKAANMSNSDFTRIDQVQAYHSGWFFLSSAMRFFRCRLSQTVYGGPGGIFFVTSEQCAGNPRLYTVRQWDRETDTIHTVGTFQQYATGRAAQKVAQRLAAAEEPAAPESQRKLRLGGRNLPGYSTTRSARDGSFTTRHTACSHQWTDVGEVQQVEGEWVQTLRCGWCGKSRLERTTADPEPVWHTVVPPGDDDAHHD